MINQLILNNELFTIEELVNSVTGETMFKLTTTGDKTLLFYDLHSRPELVIDDDLHERAAILKTYHSDMSEGDVIELPNIGKIEKVYNASWEHRPLDKITIDGKTIWAEEYVIIGIGDDYDQVAKDYKDLHEKTKKFIYNLG